MWRLMLPFSCTGAGKLHAPALDVTHEIRKKRKTNKMYAGSASRGQDQIYDGERREGREGGRKRK